MATVKRPGFAAEDVPDIDDTVFTDSDGNKRARVTTSTDPTSSGNLTQDSMNDTLQEIRDLLKLQNELIKGLY